MGSLASPFQAIAPADFWAASPCAPMLARAVTSALRHTCPEGVAQAQACVCGWLQTRPWGCASDSTKHRHAPGGSWKRPTTLFSGVLKKAAAIELYSPSAQKSCKVGREYRPVGWGSPGLDSIRHQPQGRMGLGSCLGEGKLRFSGPYLQPPVLQSLSSHCSGRRTRARLQPDRTPALLAPSRQPNPL